MWPGLAIALAVAVLIPALQCQTTQGVISGRVLDALTGEPVEGVTVTVSNLASDVERAVKTEVSGEFVLWSLTPGQYRIRFAALDRYQAQELSNLDLPVSGNLRLEARLRLLKDVWEQQYERTIFLPGRGVLLFYGPDVDASRTGSFEGNGGRTFPQEASLSQAVDARRVRDLPLAGRDLYTILSSEPGVTSTSATIRGLGFSVNGQRPSSSMFLLDGLQNNNTLTTGPLMILAPEAMEVYRISTNNFSAEYGGTSGFVANAISKSGTNEWHGLAYAYFKDEALNTNDFQNNAAGRKRSPAQELQPGVLVGGPLVRSRLFASGAYELLRYRSVSEIVPVLLPTALFRPVPGSRAEQILSRFPAPVVPAASGPIGFGEFEPPVTFRRQFALPRVDSSFRDGTQRLMARVALNSFTRPDFIWSPYEQFTMPLRQRTRSAALNWTAAVTARWTTEVRAGWHEEQLGFERRYRDIPSLLTGDSVRLADGRNLSGVVLPGSRTDYGFDDRTQRRELVGNFMWNSGRHNLKAGGEILRRRSDGYFALVQAGAFRFSTLAEFGADQVVFAQWMGSRLGGAQPPDFNRSYRQAQWSSFVHDVWSPQAGLAFTFGLRYEYFGPPVGAGSASDVVLRPGPGGDPVTRLQGAAWITQSKLPLYDADRNDWAPRVGFSWDLMGNGRTVLRGGFGIFYDRPFDNLWQPLRNNAAIEMRYTRQPGSDFTPNYLAPLPQRFANIPDASRTSTFPRPLLYQDGVRDPYLQSAFLTVSERIRAGWTVELSALGSHGVKLLTSDIINRDNTPGYPVSLSNRFGRFAPDLPPLVYRGNQGTSSYRALAFSNHLRARSGEVFVTYTFGRSLDEQSDAFAGNIFNLTFARTGLPSFQVQDASFTRQFDPSADRGHSDFDQRHSLVTQAIWDLPAPQGLSRLQRLLHGWKIAHMAAFRSGFPYSVTVRAGGQTSLTNNRADRAPGREVEVRVPYPGGIIVANSAAFERPAASTLLGNTHRNSLYGPGAYNVDLSLSKTASAGWLGESGSVQFRVDAFNVLNHANLGQPITCIDCGQAEPFGFSYYGRRERETGFPILLPFTEGARNLQLMLRISF